MLLLMSIFYQMLKQIYIASISKQTLFSSTKPFFKEKIKNISIKTMITLISIRKLKTTKHMTNKYVILSMYFEDIKTNKFVKTIITRKIHLVKDFKTNLLIENDILNSKKIDISNFTKTTYIDHCEIIISIIIKTEIRSQTRSIHAFKTLIISFKSECLISIHAMIFFSNRDFLFEFKKTSNLITYVHLMNLSSFFILIRNERKQVVKILRNFRLNTLTKFDYSNVYQAYSKNVFDLIIRHFKLTHKFFYFQKVIIVVATLTSFFISICHNIGFDSTNIVNLANDIYLSNEIIIHNFFAFTNLIDIYFKL